ncbi:MAG: type II methionyl aminopeptidase [Nanoarchaeota archaeon]
MNQEELAKYIKAGKIAVKIKKFIKGYIKPNMKLIDIAIAIHKEIEKYALPAFPVNLSIDGIAAHFHPTLDNYEVAKGLLKVDFGISVDGYIADTAISLDLTSDNKYKKLIEASEQALENAIGLLKENPSIHEIGKKIQKTIESKGFSPITNLSGHSIEKYEIHAGLTIPNYGNNNSNKLKAGVYAIEPFSTIGEGRIYEGASGNIYSIIAQKKPRSEKAREIFDYVFKKYKTLPFSLREVQEKFGLMARISLKELENQGVIKTYNQLIEKTHKPIAQSEHTIIIIENKGKREVIVTTSE